MPFDLRRAQPARPGRVGSLVAVLAIVFVALAILVATEAAWLQDLDDDVAGSAFDLSAGHAGWISILEFIATAFGAVARLSVLALVAAYAWWRHERRMAIWIGVATVLATAGNALLKQLFDRQRPQWVEPLTSVSGSSFPSGHAVGAGLFCTVMILGTIVLTGRGWKRRLIVVFWLAFGLVIAADRVFLGVHFLSDVLAGLALGAFVALTSWKLLVDGTARMPHVLAAVTGTGGKRVSVIFNPIKVGDIEEFKSRVRAAAARHGWSEPRWWETTVADPGAGQAQEALEAGTDLIIAAGGDGTVRVVCHELARTGVAVGILPHGTGNLLARNLAIPLNIKDALDTVFSGQDRAVDLATYTGDVTDDTVFLVMAGLGMDAAIMTGVDDTLKAKVGWIAYFVSGVKASRFAPVRVSISVDDAEFVKYRARTVVVGNVGFLQGGIPLLPDAQIDDGVLDVVVIAPKRFLGWLFIIARVMGRQRRTNSRLDRMTGKKVVIRTEKPVPMQLDGDPIGEGTEIVAEVQPGVLLVRVPLAPAPAP